MPTDFERELSALLNSVTPEPPEHLSAPRVATLPELSRTDADADVIELSTATTKQEPGRRYRWPAVLAAAAVAALAAGVVAIIQLGDGQATHQPIGSPTPTSNTATVPPCRNSQIVISQGPHLFATRGRAGAAQVTYTNRSPKQCLLALPSVTIGPDTTGGRPFPASHASVRLSSQAHLVITAHVQVTGQCRTVKDGLLINLSQDGWTYSSSIGVTGCILTPLRVTHHVIG
jgi:hypothetical protein